MQSEKHFLTFGYNVTNVVVQWFFFITVPPGGGFVLDCIMFQGVSNIL